MAPFRKTMTGAENKHLFVCFESHHGRFSLSDSWRSGEHPIVSLTTLFQSDKLSIQPHGMYTPLSVAKTCNYSPLTCPVLGRFEICKYISFSVGAEVIKPMLLVFVCKTVPSVPRLVRKTAMVLLINIFKKRELKCRKCVPQKKRSLQTFIIILHLRLLMQLCLSLKVFLYFLLASQFICERTTIDPFTELLKPMELSNL